jgi:hypothetical protein
VFCVLKRRKEWMTVSFQTPCSFTSHVYIPCICCLWVRIFPRVLLGQSATSLGWSLLCALGLSWLPLQLCQLICLHLFACCRNGMRFLICRVHCFLSLPYSIISLINSIFSLHEFWTVWWVR